MITIELLRIVQHDRRLIKQLNRKRLGCDDEFAFLWLLHYVHSKMNRHSNDGGTWDTRSESFQGNIAEQVLRSYDFDQLFIGADGIDLNVVQRHLMSWSA